MLRRIKVHNFKSFRETEVELPQLAVFFGPNAVGKSNLIDAVQALSRIGTRRTFADALSEPIRGYPIEMFKLPSGGLEELLSVPTVQFSLEADLAITNGKAAAINNYRYRIMVEIATDSGGLSNREEFLSALNRRGELKGSPAIELDKSHLIIRRQKGGGRPRSEELGGNYALLSDQRLGSPAHEHIERVRNELADWQTYYLDPQLSMRTPRPPIDVYDLGDYGQYISPFLYKLKSEHKKYFDGVIKTVRTIIPSIEEIDVDLDKRQGILDLYIRQHGTNYSSRVISEGTLRVLGLCAIAVNPWNGSLVAFEEPENGVHPKRIELIAQLLVSLSGTGTQVIVTTHSPIFCNEVLKHARSKSSHDMGLFTFQGNSGDTELKPFPINSELFEETEVLQELTSSGEDGLFEALVMRGFIDE